MDKETPQYNAADLLKILSNSGFAQDQVELTRVILSEYQAREFPVYLKLILSMGAFISAACLIFFLTGVKLIHYNRASEMFIWSMIFMGTALAIWLFSVPNNKTKHWFFIPFSFALMIAGKLLFVFALSNFWHSAWSMTLGWFMVAAVTYTIYPLSLDRFFSAFAFLSSLFIEIVSNVHFNQGRSLLLDGVILFQFVGAVILLIWTRSNRNYSSLAYAFVCSLCSSVLFLCTNKYFFRLSYEELLHSIFFMNLLLTGGLIALFAWVAGGLQKLKTEPLLLASIVAVLLGIISVPGVLLSIALLILGYAQHEKPLVILGILLMPVFLFLYYYSLDVSLLQKSFILLGSGAILLMGRGYLHYKGWNKGTVSCVQK
ncbi:MAG: DUF4401 domain-containing protein [Gammaproteobacteria bacterium]|nr:DUF4401 domain-containing protein [Gammaproteobacteria bacterium]